MAAAARGDLVAKLLDRRVQAKLQDRVDLAARVALQIGQAVEVPGVQHQRLLADHVGACP